MTGHAPHAPCHCCTEIDEAHAALTRAGIRRADGVPLCLRTRLDELVRIAGRARCPVHDVLGCCNADPAADLEAAMPGQTMEEAAARLLVQRSGLGVPWEDLVTGPHTTEAVEVCYQAAVEAHQCSGPDAGEALRELEAARDVLLGSDLPPLSPHRSDHGP